jgi:hypothetical protein
MKKNNYRAERMLKNIKAMILENAKEMNIKPSKAFKLIAKR